MDIAQRIAEAAADSGVCQRFIHVSCLGASPDAPSRRLQTKARVFARRLKSRFRVCACALALAQARTKPLKPLNQVLLQLTHISCSRESSLVQAAGEEAVRKAFPGATVLKPSVMVGTEDRLFNTWARLAMNLPYMPLAGRDAHLQVIPFHASLSATCCPAGSTGRLARIARSDQRPHRGKLHSEGHMAPKLVETVRALR